MITIGFTNIIDGHHDNSVAIVRDGKLVFASTEERFSRIKHDSSFPRQALQAGLDYCGITLADVDYFATGWTETPFYAGLFERGPFDALLTGAQLAISAPFKTLSYANFRIRENQVRRPAANVLEEMGVPAERIIRFGHYEAHAASAYYTAGHDEALSVNIDAMGTTVDGSNLLSGGAYHCKDGKIELIEAIPLFASMGLFYSAVTVMLGFKFNDGEWKTMGLAAYGDPTVCYDELLPYSPRFVNGKWESFPGWTDYRIVENKDLVLSSRTGRAIGKLIKKYGDKNVAAAAQQVFEDVVSEYFDYLLEKTGPQHVVLAGGSFLNVKFNMLLRAKEKVKSVYTHPHAGDGGIASGAALAVYAMKSGGLSPEYVASAALGVEFSDDEIEAELQNFADDVSYEKLADISDYVGKALPQGKVIGWFQGRAEWGPRALGHRSVVADPRSIETKDRINSQLKGRDWFMPFAPAILYERAEEYFLPPGESAFMTMAFDVVPGKEKDIPAAIHVDDTARPQTVRREVNPRYYDIIKTFAEETGVPVVLNTSFNRHGLPIVNAPKEAIEHLIWGCIDELAIGSYIVRRKHEPVKPS